MLLRLFLIAVVLRFHSSQLIQTLNELTIEEELPIGSIVTSLTDKIANLDQAIEYDLIKPLSSDWDLFSINHSEHSLVVKSRVDYEKLCSKLGEKARCSISVSIAVANAQTIDVYLLPIQIVNINDNRLRFPVNRTVIEIDENDRRWFEKSYALPRAIDDDGDPISYSLYLQNWQRPTNLFELDEINLRLKPLKSFDREEENIYLLRLVAHNEQDFSLDVIVLIKDVNDHSPRCAANPLVMSIANVSTPTTFELNVTDLDEGDNGRLEFVLVDLLPGFSVDRSHGQIRFEPKNWRRTNRSRLTLNVSDHGRPQRLSSECFVEIRFPNFFRIEFESARLSSNTTDIFLPFENLRQAIGVFRLFDQFEKKICSECQMNFSTSLPEIFRFNASTFELFWNENSFILMRILTNLLHWKENLSVELTATVFHPEHPSSVSRQTFSFLLHFDKHKLFHQFHQLYLRIDETVSLHHRIPLGSFEHPCLTPNRSVLVDPTETFVLDRNSNLVLRKILDAEEENFYELKIENRCSIDVFVHVVDPFSPLNVYPHLVEPFAVLSSRTLNEFSLPKLPPHVKYFSSVPDLIAVDPTNGSIRLLSPTLRTFSYYDFQLQTDDSRTPSFSSAMGIRIFFIVNENPPQLSINSSRQTFDASSSRFLFQVNAFDPDLLLTDQTKIFPPSIEFELEPNESLRIEPFSGRIFRRTNDERELNFTLIITDFGQPTRLTSRHQLSFQLKPNEEISVPMILLGTSIVVILTIFTGLILMLVACCCCCCFRSISHDDQAKASPTSWTNVSPHTPDTRLIDHEYVSEEHSFLLLRQKSFLLQIGTSLPREHRLVISHSSLDKLAVKAHDDQQCLSMSDINKYLERFEKIYHDSSSQQYLHQPIGSVV